MTKPAMRARARQRDRRATIKQQLAHEPSAVAAERCAAVLRTPSSRINELLNMPVAELLMACAGIGLRGTERLLHAVGSRGDAALFELSRRQRDELADALERRAQTSRRRARHARSGAAAYNDRAETVALQAFREAGPREARRA